MLRKLLSVSPIILLVLLIGRNCMAFLCVFTCVAAPKSLELKTEEDGFSKLVFILMGVSLAKMDISVAVLKTRAKDSSYI